MHHQVIENALNCSIVSCRKYQFNWPTTTLGSANIKRKARKTRVVKQIVIRHDQFVAFVSKNNLRANCYIFLIDFILRATFVEVKSWSWIKTSFFLSHGVEIWNIDSVPMTIQLNDKHDWTSSPGLAPHEGRSSFET